MDKSNETPMNIFHGYKNAELVYYDNDAHRNFMIFLEWDENVWTYFQPNMHMVLEWRKNEQMYINIDFQVERAGNKFELVHLFVGEEFEEEIWSRANRYANALNMEFNPVRVMDITEEPRCSNLQLLWNDARLKVLSIHIAMLNQFFREVPKPNVRKLRSALNFCGLDSRLANSFLFHRAVIADLENNPINENTVIRQNRQFEIKSRIAKPNGSKDDLFTFF